jgi:hypothetical protein
VRIFRGPAAFYAARHSCRGKVHELREEFGNDRVRIDARHEYTQAAFHLSAKSEIISALKLLQI